MKVQVEEWGGGLALRIPSEYADEAGISDGSTVEMTLIGGEIVVRPEARSRPSLDELLDRVTPENLHREWETGPAVGNEAW